MTPYEFAYSNLVQQVLEHGDERETRNGKTKSLFGTTLRIGGLADGHFPLLQGRRILSTFQMG
jgi:thymidylate synthase